MSRTPYSLIRAGQAAANNGLPIYGTPVYATADRIVQLASMACAAECWAQAGTTEALSEALAADLERCDREVVRRLKAGSTDVAGWGHFHELAQAPTWAEIAEGRQSDAPPCRCGRCSTCAIHAYRMVRGDHPGLDTEAVVI